MSSSSGSSSSSNSPCAACKTQRRKCTQECVFAPYFPPDNPQRFAYVHKVFGASNVAKLLSELTAAQREDAVKSLAYEAEARLRDPVYGCVGLISLLQHKLKQLQAELSQAKNELANYAGPHSVLPLLQPHQQQQPRNNLNGSISVFPYGAANSGMPVHEMIGFDSGSTGSVLPSLALGPSDQYYSSSYHNHHHHQQQQQLQAHLMLSSPPSSSTVQPLLQPAVVSVSQKYPMFESSEGRTTSWSAGPSSCC